MVNQTVIEKMYSSAIIPVVAIEHSEDAVGLGKAFLEAGVQIIEVTFRTEAAADAIRALSESDLDILVGAGTVLTVEMAQRAVDAGADFLVTPGFDDEVVAWAVEHNISIFPGVTSPSEIARASKFGLKILKFFPSESSGGIGMLKALAGPYKDLRFIPTGGINVKNIGQYMEQKNVLACGGSWICSSKLICAHEFAEITRLTKEAVQSIHDFFLLHLGINARNAIEAKEIADAYSTLLGLPVFDGSTFFIGDMIEINKMPGKGAHGHIAISVRNIDRAMAYLKAQGYQFDEENMPADEQGIIAAYLEGEFGGFAVHLRRHL